MFQHAAWTTKAHTTTPGPLPFDFAIELLLTNAREKATTTTHAPPSTRNTLRSESQHRIQHRIYYSPLPVCVDRGRDGCDAHEYHVSAAVDIAPRTKGKRGPKDWCASEVMKREIHEAVRKRG